MKTLAAPFFALALTLTACLPLQFPMTASTPTLNSQATLDTIIQTGAAQTIQAAQPTPTPVPVTDTLPPLQPILPTQSGETLTATLAPNLTTTPATATSGPTLPTSTPTLASGLPTPTWTLGVRTFGTLPPAVPFTKVTLINKSKAEAYISLQNYSGESPIIIEYPVEKQVTIQAPLGRYIFVVWVGGRKLSGSFSLHRDQDLIITIYRDRVTLN
ncbi:MAG TPA: hypothetical protein VNK49_02945 [Anaerolineales bacterium]|nr:hypothetical protein [Anaerolineales bacterium]